MTPSVDDARAAADASDAVTIADAVAIDAGPCDRSADFSGEVAVNGAYDVPGATVTYDERVVYYHTGGDYQISRAERASRVDAFGVGAPAPGAPNLVFDPATTVGETALFFHSGQGRLLRMTRQSDADPFSDWTDLGIDGTAAFPSPRALYFSAGGDLYAASLSGGVVGAPQRLDSLATGEHEDHPVVSSDDLEIVFLRGGSLLIAQRAAVDADFGSERPVDLAASGELLGAGFSEDGCRLYVTALPTGGAPALYVLSRP